MKQIRNRQSESCVSIPRSGEKLFSRASRPNTHSASNPVGTGVCFAWSKASLYEPVHLAPRFQKRGAVSPLPSKSDDPTTADCNWPHINLSSYDAGSPHYVLTEDQLSFQWSQSHSSTEMFNSPSPAAPAQMQLSPWSSVLKLNKFMLTTWTCTELLLLLP